MDQNQVLKLLITKMFSSKTVCKFILRVKYSKKQAFQITVYVYKKGFRNSNTWQFLMLPMKDTKLSIKHTFIFLEEERKIHQKKVLIEPFLNRNKYK